MNNSIKMLMAIIFGYIIGASIVLIVLWPRDVKLSEPPEPIRIEITIEDGIADTLLVYEQLN